MRVERDRRDLRDSARVDESLKLSVLPVLRVPPVALFSPLQSVTEDFGLESWRRRKEPLRDFHHRLAG